VVPGRLGGWTIADGIAGQSGRAPLTLEADPRVGRRPLVRFVPEDDVGRSDGCGLMEAGEARRRRGPVAVGSGGAARQGRAGQPPAGGRRPWCCRGGKRRPRALLGHIYRAPPREPGGTDGLVAARPVCRDRPGSPGAGLPGPSSGEQGAETLLERSSHNPRGGSTCTVPRKRRVPAGAGGPRGGGATRQWSRRPCAAPGLFGGRGRCGRRAACLERAAAINAAVLVGLRVAHCNPEHEAVCPESSIASGHFPSQGSNRPG